MGTNDQRKLGRCQLEASGFGTQGDNVMMACIRQCQQEARALVSSLTCSKEGLPSTGRVVCPELCEFVCLVVGSIRARQGSALA